MAGTYLYAEDAKYSAIDESLAIGADAFEDRWHQELEEFFDVATARVALEAEGLKVFVGPARDGDGFFLFALEAGGGAALVGVDLASFGPDEVHVARYGSERGEWLYGLVPDSVDAVALGDQSAVVRNNVFLIKDPRPNEALRVSGQFGEFSSGELRPMPIPGNDPRLEN